MWPFPIPPIRVLASPEEWKLGEISCWSDPPPIALRSRDEVNHTLQSGPAVITHGSVGAAMGKMVIAPAVVVRPDGVARVEREP